MGSPESLPDFDKENRLKLPDKKLRVPYYKSVIIAYDDGSALQYETEKLDEIKSKIYGVLSPSKDGHFEILGKISNVSKNSKVYYGNNYRSVEIKTTKYDFHSKTMTFDLYANINDIVDGLAFAGDINILEY